MTVVLTTSPGFGKYGRVPAMIEKRGWEFIRASDPSKPDGGVSEHIARADFLVVGLVPVTAETFDGASKLKAVLKHGVGVDNIDIPTCTMHAMPVCNTPAANADAVAELAMGFMFSLSRHIPQGHASVVSGGWDRQPGSQLGGKILGIVGFGNIGQRLAKLARGIGMAVMATDPFADQVVAKQNGVELVDLDTLLAKADYVSLHVFGSKENVGLIDAGKLALMKPTARVMNLSRGEVLDLDAVAAAMEAGKLAGLALDAYDHEPPDVSHPVFSLPRTVFTPHSGADTLEAFENMGLMVINDIEALERGELPARCLNAKELGR